MEILFEFIGEIVLELGINLVRNKKISRWIRYPVGILIAMFYIVVIGGIAILGYIALKELLAVTLILWGLDLFFVTELIKKLLHKGNT